MTETTTTSSGGDEPIARTASTLAAEAGRTAEHKAGRTMDRAAETLEAVGDAVRQASDGLREQQPQIASVADMALEQVDRSTRYLREHEPREIVSEAESWMRRQPALAIGGALVLGIVAGRFLRSASPPAGQSTGSGHRGLDSTYDRAVGYGSDGAQRGRRSSVVGSYEAAGADRTGFASTGVAAIPREGDLDDDALLDADGIEVVPDGVVDDGIDELAAGTTRVTAESGVR